MWVNITKITHNGIFRGKKTFRTKHFTFFFKEGSIFQFFIWFISFSTRNPSKLWFFYLCCIHIFVANVKNMIKIRHFSGKCLSSTLVYRFFSNFFFSLVLKFDSSSISFFASQYFPYPFEVFGMFFICSTLYGLIWILRSNNNDYMKMNNPQILRFLYDFSCII